MNRHNRNTKGRLHSGAGGWLRRAVLGLLALSFSCFVLAQEVQLKKSSFVALPGHKLEVRFDFDSAPPMPRAYTIDNPPRVVMDFPGVHNDLGTRKLDIKSGQVDSLDFAEAQGRMRVVANLNEPVQYKTYTQNNSLFVEFGGANTGAKATPVTNLKPQAKSVVSQRKRPIDDGRTRVKGIDFERVDGGVGRVVITMSDDKAGLDIVEEGNNVVVNLAGAALSDNLEQRVNVQDFATPVMYIDSMASGNNTAILIKPSADPYDYMAYQTGNKLVLDFKPLTAQQQADRKKDLFPYTGEKIDLNFQDVSVRSILQIIAEVAHMNLVVSDAVDKQAGNITLRLKNVPWDQALDIILKAKGLDKREVGNVLMIGTANEIQAREDAELKSQQKQEELAPLKTEFIQIDFRRASEMKKHIEDAKLISKRGFVLADDQTNVLMVRETAQKIDEIRRTLKNFDVEVAQIMIEARIVTATTNFAKDIGVRWGFADNGNLGDVTIGNTAGDVGQVNTGMMVDLGAATTNSIAVGIAGNSLLLSAELSAMESDGEGEVISQPKVITTNGKPAMIKSGQEVPYQTRGDNNTVTTDFKDVALTLEVTPQINPGSRIALDLKINQDNIGDTLSNGEIAIDTNQLETSVVVNDGDTVVLGGVFRNEKTNSVTKVPLLGDLPVIGSAFRNTQKTDKKNELLIFITPKLIRESLAVK